MIYDCCLKDIKIPREDVGDPDLQLDDALGLIAVAFQKAVNHLDQFFGVTQLPTRKVVQNLEFFRAAETFWNENLLRSGHRVGHDFLAQDRMNLDAPLGRQDGSHPKHSPVPHAHRWLARFLGSIPLALPHHPLALPEARHHPPRPEKQQQMEAKKQQKVGKS